MNVAKKRKRVAVLFACADSIYHTLPCHVYDRVRDARTYQGPHPVIAHPPCRAWGCLRQFAKPEPGEKDYGPWAVEQVRKWGGILEHPRGSSLWPHCGLPKPGHGHDEHGGYSIYVAQWWFGHRALKPTWLYICGAGPDKLPPIKRRDDLPSHVITNTNGLKAGMLGFRPEVSVREREATPLEFAQWLIQAAAKCKGKKA